jgi:hypothetical protein
MAGAGHDRLDPFGTFERGHLLSGQQLDPVRPVDGGDQRADLSAHHPLQRGLAGEDRGHLNAELRQRGRHLATDEPHADHDRALTRHRLLLDRVALGRRAQIADPGQLGPWDPEPPVTRSGGYEGLLVADLPPEPRRSAAWRDRRPRRSRGERLCRVRRTSFCRHTSLRGPFRRRYVLDSGGRPNGTPGSGPTITTGPVKPSSRRVAAALPPAKPPPTITIGLPPMLSDTPHQPGRSVYPAEGYSLASSAPRNTDETYGSLFSRKRNPSAHSTKSALPSL